MDERPNYEAKLILIGEGGTGKSSLLRAMRGQAFQPLDLTHGIEIAPLELPHPGKAGQTITLNAWDFGGQAIYHSTHQFFLTRRAIYLLVWNARYGVGQSAVRKWLANITALAPQAPILLVATHTDQHQPQINMAQLKRDYPQLVDSYPVSNKTGAGITELKQALATTAARLPHMAELWPQSWFAAMQTLQQREAHHLSIDDYLTACIEHEVELKTARTILGQYLHDLGKILYYQRDPLLKEWVILKPNWVSKAIGSIMEDAPTQQAGGVLAHAQLARIWTRYPAELHPIFLRLMGRFDLRVQIESDIPGQPSDRSLVPALLPEEPPEGLPAWPAHQKVELYYRLEFLPPDMMSWFIVRTYRYTTQQHWRTGVVLTYREHTARVELQAANKTIRLAVWGPRPDNFFNILDDTLVDILRKFEALQLKREVPCICEPGCEHRYRYDYLLKRQEKGRQWVECPHSLDEVDIASMLYGVYVSPETGGQLDLYRLQQQIQQVVRGELQMNRQALHQLSELMAREFTRQWNLEMNKLEADCPSMFILLLNSTTQFDPRNWVSQEFRLHLLCQEPSCPHLIAGDEGYVIRQPKEWWTTVSPWLGYLLTFLKGVAPMGGELAGMGKEGIEQMQEGLDVVEQMHTMTDEWTAESPEMGTLDDRAGAGRQAVGPALRALCYLLNQEDPQQHWAGLHKTPTPDGNILWLCEEHRQLY